MITLHRPLSQMSLANIYPPRPLSNTNSRKPPPIIHIQIYLTHLSCAKYLQEIPGRPSHYSRCLVSIFNPARFPSLNSWYRQIGFIPNRLKNDADTWRRFNKIELGWSAASCDRNNKVNRRGQEWRGCLQIIIASLVKIEGCRGIEHLRDKVLIMEDISVDWVLMAYSRTMYKLGQVTSHPTCGSLYFWVWSAKTVH